MLPPSPLIVEEETEADRCHGWELGTGKTIRHGAAAALEGSHIDL